MVIQRWQSVWLLIGAILVGVFCFIPMVSLPGGMEDTNSATLMSPSDLPVFLVLNIVTAVLLFFAIFLFKNMRLQKTVTLVSMLLLAVATVTECLLLYNWNSTFGRVEMFGSVLLLLGALVFTLMAYRGIRKDENTLRSADRLR